MASTLYVRREAVYFGSDQVGIIRIGQDDGPFSQFDNGVTTFQFGTGAWNGDAPDNLVGDGILVFPFCSGVGDEYANSKVAYFSPRFAGFDFGRVSRRTMRRTARRPALSRAQDAVRSRRRHQGLRWREPRRPTGMR